MSRAKKVLHTAARTRRTVAARARVIGELEEKLRPYLSESQLHFVLTQVNMGTKAARGRRWNVRDKALALSLMHSSPRTYHLLRTLFALPAVCTLRKIVQRVEIYPGFNKYILHALQLKTTAMPATSKLVVVLLDEMSIKVGVTYDKHQDSVEGFGHGQPGQLANYALVFMVRGLTEKWKLPIGYFLSSGPMKGTTMQQLLNECITELHAIGLKVMLVICDQGATNVNLFEKLLGVTVNTPFFKHDNNNILFMYDPPHLLKSVRNNLKKSGFTVDGKDILWQHIASFYELDSSKPIRMAPRLTKKHLNLPPFAPLRVRLAAQVLSHSVAAGMSAMIQWEKLPGM